LQNNSPEILSLIADWVSIIAGIMTVIGISGIVTWSIGRHLTNTMANRIFAISIQMLKIGLILLFLFILFFLWQTFYGILLVIAKGNSHNFYWDPNKPIPHILTYLISGLIFLFFSISGSFCIYLGSISPIKNLLYRWRISNISFDDLSKNAIEIISAQYGQNETFIDVAHVVKQFMHNNKIEFIASNKLFGDPLPKITKVLKMELKIRGKKIKKEFKEKEKVLITEFIH